MVRLFRKILFPVSLVYALVVHIRNYLYDVGLFESKSFVTPTVCIGNLSVGGTGKTPMAELLISRLREDYNLALLSRGYRRNSAGFHMADAQSTVGDIGDEPYQIHSKFPEIAVAVDADRRNGIALLEDKVAPDIILLDDAFQHRRVRYGLSILLTAYGNLYVDDWYLPTGNLRDSKREARRADVIVVTKCPPNLNERERRRIAQKLDPKPHQEVLFSYLEYDRELQGNGDGLSQEWGLTREADLARDDSLTLDRLADTKITLVTGIADPKPLAAYLEDAGAVYEHLRFNDHHSFTENELRQFRKKEIVLTTEKDYVRLRGEVENLYYLPIRHRFIDDGQKVLEDCLHNFIKSYS